MSLSRAGAAVVISGMVAIVLSLGISAAAQEPAPAPQEANVVWDDRPASVDELAADTTVLVEARVTGIEVGPDLLSPHPDDPISEQAIPTQRIAFETVEVLDGQIPGTFNVFKTGSADVYLEGDPLYEVAQTYVLFLEPQGEPGTWIPAAPDGRLELDASGEADPVIGGPVSAELEGLTPEQIEQEASE